MPYGLHKEQSNAELVMDYGFVRDENLFDFADIKNPFFTFSEKQQSKIFSYANKKKILSSFHLLSFVLLFFLLILIYFFLNILFFYYL